LILTVTRAEAYRIELLRAASVRKRAGKATGEVVGPGGEKALAKASGRPARLEPNPKRGKVKAKGQPAAQGKPTARTRKASYELEVSASPPKRPSRKSTRKALNRVKNDSSLRINAVNRASSPPVRAAARRTRGTRSA
jgi:hypothetical protein